MIRTVKPILLSLIFALGCAKEFRPRGDYWDSIPTRDQRARIVEDAKDLSHHRYFHANKQYIPKDCSGYVATILYKNGFDVYGGASARNIEGNGVALIQEFILRDGELFKDLPEPGDLVFFSNTYDKNNDGKVNDPLTHIGIVTRVSEDQTVTFLHFLQGKVRTGILNLSDPHTVENDSGKLNSYLRRRNRRDPANTPYLSGELFQGFGAFIKRPDDLSDLTE